MRPEWLPTCPFATQWPGLASMHLHAEPWNPAPEFMYDCTIFFMSNLNEFISEFIGHQT